MQHTVNTGLLNSRIGRIGSAARISTHTKIASATTEPTNSPMIVGEVQAYSVPPQLVARVSPDARQSDEQDAGVVDDGPGGLRRAAGWRDRGDDQHDDARPAC